MKYTKLTQMLLCSVISLSIAHADDLGGDISIGAYFHSPSGSASYHLPFQQQNSYDLKNDFGWDNETDLMLSVSLEHPVPILPNIRLSYIPMYYTGENEVENFEWGHISLPKATIATDLKLDMFDATLYYQVLDNVIECDIGLTLRKVKGKMDVSTTATYQNLVSTPLSENVAFDKIIPMGYVAGTLHVPNTDFSIRGHLNYIDYKNTTFFDFDLGARYTFMLGFGIEGGYRYIKLQSQNDFYDGITVDTDFSGFYAAAVWDF